MKNSCGVGQVGEVELVHAARREPALLGVDALDAHGTLLHLHCPYVLGVQLHGLAAEADGQEAAPEPNPLAALQVEVD